MATKSRNKKKLKSDVYLIIRNDIPLRHQLAQALNIEAESVYRSAFRESTKFSLPFIVEIIAKHTGRSKNEILEN
jgi:hypothetical protein